MQSINGGTAYSVDESGWVAKVLSDIKANRACAVVMSSTVMLDVMKAIKEKADLLTKLPLLSKLTAGLPIDPSLVVGTLAAAGSVGGVVGVVAVTAAVAHTHGMLVSASFVVPPDLLDPTKAEFHVEFSPKKV